MTPTRKKRLLTGAVAGTLAMVLMLAPAWADIVHNDHVTIKTGDTSRLRLEQDNTSGFAPQTWDVAGNETNFFVRDVTGGSRLPFRIRPGAPTSSIDIASSGNVGIGQVTPDARLHVGTGVAVPVSNGTDLFVSDDPVTVAALRSGEEGAEFFVKTRPGRAFLGTATDHALDIRTGDQRRIFIEPFAGHIGIGRGSPSHPMHFASGAHVTTAGQFVNASDRAVKDDFLSADTQAILAALVELPISTWRHVADDPSVRHIGPIAQDFNAAFGFNGDDDTAISTVDADGVALASIQALYEIVQEMQAENDELRAEVERLKEAVDP